jgi:hypothetical protein
VTDSQVDRPAWPRPGWHALAACAPDPDWSTDRLAEHVDAFYPERGDQLAIPRAFCAQCPVWEPCLLVALADSSDRGVRGGTTLRSRQALRAGEIVELRYTNGGVLATYDRQSRTLDVVGVADELSPRRVNSSAHAPSGTVHALRPVADPRLPASTGTTIGCETATERPAIAASGQQAAG